MTTQPFDPHKPFKTRSGLKAELMCDDLTGAYPLGVKITGGNGDKFIKTFTKEGYEFQHGGRSKVDLINIPERIQRTVFLHIYKDFVIASGERGEDNHARLACIPVHIDCEVGEGLS